MLNMYRNVYNKCSDGALKWNFPAFWEIMPDLPTDQPTYSRTDRVIGKFHFQWGGPVLSLFTLSVKFKKNLVSKSSKFIIFVKRIAELYRIIILEFDRIQIAMLTRNL